MAEHDWKQDALKNHPFKLSTEQKALLVTSSPWATIPEVEQICSGYLYWHEFMNKRPAKADIESYMKEYTAKLKRSLKANIDLMKVDISYRALLNAYDPTYCGFDNIETQYVVSVFLYKISSS